ncbi:MAG: DNA repair protein RecO [Patescibacteria group bacterium]
MIGESLYKTEGIIISATDLGELDRLLTIYTRGYGKISVRAISARKKESKLRGLIEPFAAGYLTLAKSKTRDILTDIQVSNSFAYLRSNLNNLAHAFYFTELIDKLISSPERDEDVWRLVARAFEVLNQKRNDLPKIKIAFEDKLVEFLGHGTASQPKPLQRLNYLQSLAGEMIKSYKFLTQI